MIQLIASDMDGTLLGSKMEILPENIEAIKFAEARGVNFMIATGRNYQEAITPLKEANITCPIIAVNGAQGFNAQGEELFSIAIEKDIALQIIQLFEENDMYFEICAHDHVYSNNLAKRIENMAMHIATSVPHLTFKMALTMAAAQLEFLPVTYIESYQELITDPSKKILKFIAFSQDEAKALTPIRELIGKLPDIVVTSSYANNLEVNHKLAQKGIAVKKMADALDISMKNVLTIGDNFNDLSMLAIAGVSFAMGNAEQEVKETAKYQTALNTEAGVGKAIMRAIQEKL